MRKPHPGEDTKEYNAEKGRCVEWNKIYMIAREIVKEMFVVGRTWTDQVEEARQLAIKALEMRVEQV